MSEKPFRETWTLDFLGWKPWMERAMDTDLSPEQMEAVEAFVGGVVEPS